jgi:hypothetical protein
MFPSKFKVSGGDAEYFDIDISITVSNSNDVGVWADMGVRLVHRRGARVPFASTAYDEVWCLFIPGMGMAIDFAQNLFPPELETQSGDMLLSITGLLMGSFGGETRYNHPGTDHRVNPNVYSSFSGRPILVPPHSNVPFQTVLTIPGPGASEGMADFWDQFGDSPDFDLQVSVVEVAWPFPDEPGPKETGQIIATQRLNDIIEIQLDRTQFDDTYDYFDDLGVFEQKSVETTWYEEDY